MGKLGINTDGKKGEKVFHLILTYIWLECARIEVPKCNIYLEKKKNNYSRLKDDGIVKVVVVDLFLAVKLVIP